MSRVARKPRRLERYRAKVKTDSVPQAPGKGKAEARAAREVNIRTALARKKASGKLAKEFDGLGVEELQTKLDEARKELFNMRFRHATGQLENVARISATRRRVARILTLMQQKEVGA